MTRNEHIRYLCLPALACMCTACAMSEEEPEPLPELRVCEPGDLVWSDEFDEDGLPNASRWRYDVGGHGWGNQELQFYTPARSENARVENGSLIIEAHKESWEGSDYTSTHLLSRAEWTPSEIRGYVNETQYFTFANERLTNSQANDRHWPFDHPFHLIFNIAVGGAWGGQQGVDPDIWPQRLQVDYVRVYGCDS